MAGLLTVQEAADKLGVSGNTVRRWEKIGKLKAFRVGTRGDRRFREEDLKAMVNIGMEEKGDDAK